MPPLGNVWVRTYEECSNLMKNVDDFARGLPFVRHFRWRCHGYLPSDLERRACLFDAWRSTWTALACLYSVLAGLRFRARDMLMASNAMIGHRMKARAHPLSPISR